MAYLLPRRAAASNLPAFRALQCAAMRGLAARHYTTAQVEAFLAHATPTEELVRHGEVWIIASGIEVVASAAWHPLGAMDTLGRAAAADRSCAVIRAVYIHPHWARRGLAARLMAHVEVRAQASGATVASLHAMRGAEGFYRALGYADGEETAFDLDGVAFPGRAMSKRLARVIQAGAAW